jgi:hypothetical protein
MVQLTAGSHPVVTTSQTGTRPAFKTGKGTLGVHFLEPELKLLYKSKELANTG